MPTAATGRTRWNYVRPWLYPRQREAIFNDKPRVLIEASTKSGKTVGVLLWLLEEALRARSRVTRNYWWIAPSYGQAADAYGRCVDGLRSGGIVTPEGKTLFETNKSDLAVELPNKAVLTFKTGEKPDNLYGRDVWAAALDEASRMRAEAWHAVDSTLTATGGPARLITNVKERTNWTAELKRKIVAGHLPEWGYYKLTWRDAVQGLAPLAQQGVDVITPEKVERARRELPRHVFEMLFESEYADDGGHPFKPQYRPLSQKPEVAWGWDLAKAADWMWGIALDEDGAIVRSHRWQHVPWPEAVGRMVGLTMSTPALVDSTGLGDPVLAYAQREGQAIFEGATGNFEGYVFTMPKKQQLMEGLAVGFEAGEVFGVACGCEGQDCPHCVLRAELEAFEYEYTKLGVRYCLGPRMRVLTADLRWTAVDKLAIGDRLLAFDEYPPDDESWRQWRTAVVTEIGAITRPTYRLELED